MKRVLVLVVGLLPLACVAEAGPEGGADPDRGPLGKADRIGSCSPDDCGGPAAVGLCWCDDACASFGDCCSNKIDACEAAACAPEDCGPQPEIAMLCDDGSAVGLTDCVMTEDGACGWEFADCPEPVPGDGPCTPLECGPSPLVLDCEGTISHAADCVRDDAGFCGWEIDDCDDPDVCTPADCGPQPEIAKLCDDGSVVGADLCIEVEEGNCGWTFPECPEPVPGEGPCGAGECGFNAPLVLDCDGQISHAADCVRQNDGLCDWQAPVCD